MTAVEPVLRTVSAPKGAQKIFDEGDVKEKIMDQFPLIVRKDRKPIRYLVVDDSVFARKNVAKMVESFGGEIVGEAGDGSTAITKYDRTAPDMVRMDITRPQMEGIEAAG